MSRSSQRAIGSGSPHEGGRVCDGYMQTVPLYNGVEMPILGFGVHQIEPAQRPPSGLRTARR
ncbi:hypothetical protein GCM10028815_20300 [Mariniluteicoccus flavus]